MEHALFFTTGLLMWSPVLETLPAPAWFGTVAKLGYVVVVRIATTILGNVFIWTDHVVYDPYLGAGTSDQALAGALMMIEGSIVTIAAFAWLFLRMFEEGERRQQLLERARPAAGRTRRPLRPRGGSLAPYDRAVAKVGCVHHLDLVVCRSSADLPLYRELLAPLGFVEVYEVVGERGEPVFYLDGEGVGASVSLREAQSPSPMPYDRYAVGLHHLAFEAPSPEVVDERLEWARGKGLEIENDPQEWPYVRGYYAGFFHDPDGIKLEIVHVP